MIKFLKYIILSLIQLIERYEYSNLKLDENDINKKILSSLNLHDYEILTDTGWSRLSHFHVTQPYTIFRIKTKTGLELDAADNHIIFKEGLIDTFIKDIKIGDKIHVKNGLDEITNIEILKHKVSMCDVTVADNNHRFYSNDILSHNTICSAIFIAWYLIFNIDKNALILSNKLDTTKEIIDKAKVIIENLPFFMKPGVLKYDVQNMKFDNGCRLIGQSTTGKAGISFTIHLLFLDEFAHIQDNIVESFFENVYPTLSSSLISRIIITSTPNGFNKFYEIYDNAVKGKNEFKAFKVDWWQVPGRDEAWKEREVGNLGGGIKGEEAFNRQYGNQFIASSSLLLDAITLKKMDKEKKEYIYHAFDEFDNIKIDVKNYLSWHPDFDIEEIEVESNYWVFSIDIAEGNGGDYSVINIFQVVPMSKEEIRNVQGAGAMYDFFKLKQVGCFASNEHGIEDFAKVIYTLNYDLFNSENVKLIIEYNAYGAVLIKYLGTIFPQRNDFDEESVVKFKHRHDAKTLDYGLKIKKDNKPILCQNFKKVVELGRLELTDHLTIYEISKFGKLTNGTYGGQSGHDDLAMSSINCSEFFNTVDYADFVEEILDLISVDLHDYMENILYKGSEKSDGDLHYDIYDLLNQ